MTNASCPLIEMRFREQTIPLYHSIYICVSLYCGTYGAYAVFVCFTDGLTARFSGGNVYSDGMLLEEGGYLCVFVYLMSLYFPLLLTYLTWFCYGQQKKCQNPRAKITGFGPFSVCKVHLRACR